MCWEVAIPAAVQTVSSLLEAGSQQNAYSQAQDAYQSQLQQARDAITQREGLATGALQQYGQQAQSQFSPYSLAGKQAIDMYKGAIGMEGGTAFNPQSSQLYQYQMKMGQDALNRQLAQRGLAGSPAAMPTFARFNEQLGAEESNRQMGYLQQLAQTGLQASGEQARYGMATGEGLSNVYGQTGRSLADLYGQGAKGAMEYGGQQSNVFGAISQGIQGQLGQLGKYFQQKPGMDAYQNYLNSSSDYYKSNTNQIQPKHYGMTPMPFGTYPVGA